MKDLKEILKKGALDLGVDLGEAALDNFFIYLDELKVWNKKINLTSIDKDEEIVTRHFLDSLTPYAFLKDAKKILDIGSGAGFPGMPLKIARPAFEVTLMDSVEKKVHFMRHIIRRLGLTGIEAVPARAEDPKIIGKYISTFDCVITRAFSELKNLLPLSLPYLTPGGVIVAIKGPAARDELREAEGYPGVNKPWIHEVKIPFDDRTNTIVIFAKPDNR